MKYEHAVEGAAANNENLDHYLRTSALLVSIFE